MRGVKCAEQGAGSGVRGAGRKWGVGGASGSRRSEWFKVKRVEGASEKRINSEWKRGRGRREETNASVIKLPQCRRRENTLARNPTPRNPLHCAAKMAAAAVAAANSLTCL